jgi:hypothetical protein
MSEADYEPYRVEASSGIGRIEQEGQAFGWAKSMYYIDARAYDTGHADPEGAWKYRKDPSNDDEGGFNDWFLNNLTERYGEAPHWFYQQRNRCKEIFKNSFARGYIEALRFEESTSSLTREQKIKAVRAEKLRRSEVQAGPAIRVSNVERFRDIRIYTVELHDPELPQEPITFEVQREAGAVGLKEIQSGD